MRFSDLYLYIYPQQYANSAVSGWTVTCCSLLSFEAGPRRVEPKAKYNAYAVWSPKCRMTDFISPARRGPQTPEQGSLNSTRFIGPIRSVDEQNVPIFAILSGRSVRDRDFWVKPFIIHTHHAGCRTRLIRM